MEYRQKENPVFQIGIRRKNGFIRNFLTLSAAVLILLGASPAVKVNADSRDRPTVRVSGNTVGIYMETDGVMVINTSQIPMPDGLCADPAGNIIRAGDYICSVNQEPLTGKQQLIDMVEESGGKPMELLIRRENEQIPVSVQPVMSADGTYKLGIWVRDNIQGIGTLTYVQEDGTFGALGHAISDVDTGEILNLKDGELYLTQILSIVRGEKGNPGELQGIIHYEQGYRIGSITENSGLGIHGRMEGGDDKGLNLQQAQVAWREEVTTGPVRILTGVDGQVCEYDAEIIQIDDDAADTNKSLTIRITDPELLEKTGGIVQGMSGSPILQSGKLVGAVTHVFVNDPTAGYGIYIGDMMETER